MIKIRIKVYFVSKIIFMKLFVKITLAGLLVFGCTHLWGQKQGQPIIDSLLQELSKQKEDTNKVNLLNDLSFDYRFTNSDEGLKCGQQALELSTKLKWGKGKAIANAKIGLNFFYKSEYDKAIECYDTSLKMFEDIGSKNGIAGVIGNIGNVYATEGHYAQALGYYFKALKMAEDIGNKNGIALHTGNIGNVYNSQSDFPKALEYYFKALTMEEEIGDKSLIARVTGNIGNVYQSVNDFPKALEYYFKALKMDEEIGDKNGIARVTGNIGTVYFKQRDYPKALEYYSTALKLDEEIGNKQYAAGIIGNIGEIYTSQENYSMAIIYEQKALKMDEEIGDKHTAAWQSVFIGHAYLSLATEVPLKAGAVIHGGEFSKTAFLCQAIDYLRQGLVISKEINAPDVMQDCYENLAKSYKLSGDYKKALESADNYRAIKDSVFSQENDKKIIQMGMKNEYDRQHLADSLKTDAKEKITHIQLQRQRSYTFMGISGILLLAGFSFFIAKERRKSEKLLLNILPVEVAAELKSKGVTKAKHFDQVTVLFTDFVNFTHASERMSPQALIDELHECFKAFDDITGKYDIEKIKTIGDAYLAVCGLPLADPKHAENIVRAAIEINAFMQARMAKMGNSTFAIRIGVHSGSVVAGIVGVKKFAYDIWGDTVNTAARMEQNSEAGRINISQTTFELLKDKFTCEYRGEITAKNKGDMKMYFVNG